MNDEILLATIEANDRRRDERRRFIKFAGGATIAAGGLSLLAACDNNGDDAPGPNPTPSPTPAPSPSPSPSPTPTSGVTDADILNFALNLEYLEAQFYSFAAYGVGLPANLLTGTQTQGGVTGGRQVNFVDPVIAAYAREIANDEIAHVTFLRAQLGTAAVAQPALNISGDATGAFTALGRAAGVVGPTATFDPYASDENFLLGAFIFEDVGVTAYKGAAPLLVSKVFLEASAGILAAEAYHAGLVRTVLYGKGIATPSLLLVENAGKISDLRDSVDGTTDLDQGIAPTTGPNGTLSNIVPTDASGLAFSRNSEQVHNIVYLNATGANREQGGFFPAGTNNANPALTVGLA